MDVACGQCIGCRLDRARMWAMRITHECTLHEAGNGNSFVTLTYRSIDNCSNEQRSLGKYIPDNWSLNKKHFQDFMKRLRKTRPDAKLKYYHCGEYGSICRHGIDLNKVKCPMCNVGRPHYHAILFNCSFNDLRPYGVNHKTGEDRYTSKELEDIWGYGFVDVGNVTFQSAGYVARYCMKKVNGQHADEHYSSIDTETGEIIQLEHEYSTMSNGIGKDWFNKYKTDVFPSDEVPVPGEGVVKKVPRYYEEIMKTIDEDVVEEVKEARQKFRRDNEEEYTPERLMSKYKIKKAQVGLLGNRE